jgi:hypothetical protein
LRFFGRPTTVSAAAETRVEAPLADASVANKTKTKPISAGASRDPSSI